MQNRALHRFMRISPLIIFLLFAGTTVFAKDGLLTAPKDITQLTEKAQNIVHGQVIAVKREPHPEYSNLQTIVVSLKVKEIIKGPSFEVFTFRQVILGVQPFSKRVLQAKECILFP